MNPKNKIKLVYLFDKYPMVYQEYIRPVVENLDTNISFEFSIKSYSKADIPDHKVQVLSHFKGYRIYTQFHRLFIKKKSLSYPESKMLKYDIVHIQHSYLFPRLLNLIKLPQSERPKIVITLRGGDTYVKPWIYNKWLNFYRNYGIFIDAFVTMSDHQKEYLHNKWGVDKEKIHVIPISFGSKFNILPKKPSSNKIKIVSIFRMCWEKNIDGNLRVIKNLYEKGLPVEYNIYGDGPDTGQLLFLIDKYNLHNCVKYYGKVTNSLLKKQILNYDFLLQLSHSEAFPTSVIEAQSFGIPVVVANSGGLKDAIIPNGSGYYIDANDIISGAEYIESLWKQPELYKKFSEEAINFAQSNFAVENEVERLTKLYLSLV